VGSVYETRRQRLRQLITEHGGPLPLAKALGLFGSSYLVQLAGPNPRREVSEKFARKIEHALRLPAGWMDESPSPLQRAAEAPATYRTERTIAEAAGAVLAYLDARGRRLDPETIGALIDIVHAHGTSPALLDRLLSLIDLLKPARR
jgi:hypothetical protein